MATSTDVVITVRIVIDPPLLRWTWRVRVVQIVARLLRVPIRVGIFR
jgi:hypothetical protein